MKTSSAGRLGAFASIFGEEPGTDRHERRGRVTCSVIAPRCSSNRKRVIACPCSADSLRGGFDRGQGREAEASRGDPSRAGPGVALLQPRAVMARVRRAGPGVGRKRGPAAAGARQVHGDLRPEPGRVLPDPRGRAEGAGRGRVRSDLARWPDRRASSSTRSASGSCADGAPDEDLREETPPALRPEGIQLVDWEELEREDHKHLRETFEERVFPVLTPLAVDPAHPFPYISNLSLNLAIVVRDPDDAHPPVRARQGAADPPAVRPDARRRAGSCRSSSSSPRTSNGCSLACRSWRTTRSGSRATPTWSSRSTRRTTCWPRSRRSLRRRQRSPEAVRLEVDASMPRGSCDAAHGGAEPHPARRLRDRARSAWATSGAHGARPARPEGRAVDGHHAAAARARGESRADFFEALREGDVLVHHPYDSFRPRSRPSSTRPRETPVLADQADALPDLGRGQPGRASLVRAAEEGKQVVALVELKARFDEETNIGWARVLEEAGVHVVYGVVGLKTHAKIALVVREEGDGIRRYCHVGTGNYNPGTAGDLRGHRAAHGGPRDRGRRRRPVQLPHRLQPAGDYREILVAPLALRARAARHDPRGGSRREGRADRDEDEQPRGPADDRRAVRGVAGRHRDRPDRPRHLLPAPRGRRAVGEHPGALDRRAVPRALAGLPLRRAARARRATASAPPT